MPPPWFFCNLRLPITKMSSELLTRRLFDSRTFVRLVDRCGGIKPFSSIRPALIDHSVGVNCVSSSLLRFKTFSTCVLCRTKIPPPKIDLGKRPIKKVVKRMMTTRERNITSLLYLLSAAVGTVGASYAAVPLYRAYCQSSGYGGAVKEGHDTEKVATMVKAEDRLLTIKFNADTASSMRWNFRPQQPVVHVYPGETALAFYTARNPTSKSIDGISTYNVVPFEAAPYFNKIQCFCFEEQRLNPNEEVDMPVFFYIDPDYVDDPFLENVNEITLSYTFFESKPGLTLPTYMSSSRS